MHPLVSQKDWERRHGAAVILYPESSFVELDAGKPRNAAAFPCLLLVSLGYPLV